MTDGSRPPTPPETDKPAEGLVIYPRDYDGLHRAVDRVAPLPAELALTRSDYEQFRAFVLERTGLEATTKEARRGQYLGAIVSSRQ